MKKVFAILVTAGFLAGMSACGGSAPAPVVPDEPQQVEETTVDEGQEVGGDEEAAEDVQMEEQVQE